jgi:hypothetical protein
MDIVIPQQKITLPCPKLRIMNISFHLRSIRPFWSQAIPENNPDKTIISDHYEDRWEGLMITISPVQANGEF